MWLLSCLSLLREIRGRCVFRCADSVVLCFYSEKLLNQTASIHLSVDLSLDELGVGSLVLLCYRQALTPHLLSSAAWSGLGGHTRVNACISILYLCPFIIAPLFLSFVA